MKKEELEEMQEAIKSEFDDVRASVKDAISEEQAAKFDEVREELAEVKTDLLKKMDEGESPTAQSVRDLEDKLDEAEKKIKDTDEQLRLLKAHPILPSAPDPNVPGIMRADFGGAFIKNPKDLMRALANRWQGGMDGDVRALDTGLFSGGGQLPGEAATAFIDFVISMQTSLQRVTTLTLNAPEAYTDELRVSSRKSRKAVEGTVPSALADSVTMHRRTMNTVERIFPEDVSLTLLEDNIARGGLENNIARLIGLAFGNDANDLAWNGDASASDLFLLINNGWLTLAIADAEVTDLNASASSRTLATEIFQAAMQGMPDKFKARPDNTFFVPVAMAMNYADEVSARQTAFGDSVLTDGFTSLRYFGVPVVAEPHLLSSGASGALTPAANLHYAIQRQVTVDSEWVPRKRLIEYTITAREDYQYATGEAFVRIYNIPAGLL
jgi:hypothetical protein